MSKGKNNKINNNKKPIVSVKQTQLKPNKNVINKNIKNVDSNLGKKKPIMNNNKMTIAKDSKNVDKSIAEEDEIDDEIYSDMDDVDLGSSEDDYDDSDLEIEGSDMEDMCEDSDEDLNEEEDDEEMVEEDENEVEELENEEKKKITEKSIKKMIENTKKEIKVQKEVNKGKDVEKDKKETKKEKKNAKKEKKKAEKLKKQAEKRTKKDTNEKKNGEKESKQVIKTVKEIKVVDLSTEEGKLLTEMNKRKNALSSCIVSVNKVPKEFTSQQLKELAANAITVNLPTKMRKGKPMNRGYGFLRFASAKECAEAISQINGKIVKAEPFVCKKVMDDINHVNFSKIILTSYKNEDISEEIKKRFPTGVTVNTVNVLTYELTFDNKGDAMALFNQEKVLINGGDVTVNFVYNGGVDYKNVTVPVATVPVVVKAGMKRSRVDSEEEIVSKKVKVDEKTPLKAQQKTPAKGEQKTPAKGEQKTPAKGEQKTPAKGEQKTPVKINSTNNTPRSNKKAKKNENN